MLSYQRMQTFLMSIVCYINLLLATSIFSAHRSYNVGYTNTGRTVLAPHIGPAFHSNGLSGKKST